MSKFKERLLKNMQTQIRIRQQLIININFSDMVNYYLEVVLTNIKSLLIKKKKKTFERITTIK